MSELPTCPKCGSEYVYEDGGMYICPECAYEWSKEGETESAGNTLVVTDANGNVLNDGDTITVIKDLKVNKYNISKFIVHILDFPLKMH